MSDAEPRFIWSEQLSGDRVVILPDPKTMRTGDRIVALNRGPGDVTVRDTKGVPLQVLAEGQSAIFSVLKPEHEALTEALIFALRDIGRITRDAIAAAERGGP